MKKYAFNPGMLRFGIPPKILLIMRLIIVLLTTAILQVSASTYGQQVTLNEKNVPLTTVFKEIRKQTGYDFLYSDKMMDDAKEVTIQLKNVTLETALELAFKNQQLSYTIENKMVTVKQKEKNFFDDIIARFQNIDVSGRIVDAEGNAIPGATITIKGMNRSTVSSQTGYFSLKNVDEKALLIISYIGYKTIEIDVEHDLRQIKLEIIDSQLQEIVINKGYYNSDTELNTGSVSKISGEQIREQNIANPLVGLEGRFTGVYVSQSNGVPGSNVNFNIRGKNSIAAGLNPLFIIDGIPYPSTSQSQLGNATVEGVSPFTNIRPEDIDDITVLKDADATAIYGSRGSNGVVILTTRKGKSGKTQFDVNVSQGFGRITRKLDLMNTQQYLEMRNEAFKNANAKPSASQYDVNGTWDKNRYTDWQKAFIEGTAKQTASSANISGGNDNTQFLVGASYRDESTVFPGNFNNATAGINANINHTSSNKKLNLTFNSSFTNNKNRLPQADYTTLIFLAPNAPTLYENDGQINWENNTFNNPIANNLRTATVIGDNTFTNASASYKFSNKFQFKVNGGFNIYNFSETNLTPFAALIPTTADPANNRTNEKAMSKLVSWIVEPQLNFNKSIDMHTIEALVGATLQENEQQGNTITAVGFSSDALLESIGAATTTYGNSSYSKYRYNALFARIGYNYGGKYILNLTGRRDGSSRFGPGKRFGNFGSIGAAWIFSNEKNVFKDNSFLSFGKLRGSIGRTGNDQISDYQYLDLYLPDLGYFGNSGILTQKLANQNYRWETLNKLELALELGFFKNNVMLNVSVFRNRTRDQLVGYSLPGITGFNNIIANLPATIQNRGLEIDLSSKNIKGEFSWNTTANITLPQNKLLSFPNIEATSYATQYVVGKSLDIAYRYKYAGVDPNTGLFTMEDLNKDGVINSTTDRYPVTNNRSFYGGLGNNFSFKGFSLDVFFQFVKQVGFTDIGSGGVAGSFSNRGIGNLPTIYFDRWQKPGDNATFQKFLIANTNTPFSRYRSSDARITDGSFIRLKSLSLSWQFPKILMDRLKIGSVRVFLQGQNLWTITKFKGMDPENSLSSGASTLPPLRMITTGINLSL